MHSLNSGDEVPLVSCCFEPGLPWERGHQRGEATRREFAEGHASVEAALGLRGVEGVQVSNLEGLRDHPRQRAPGAGLDLSEPPTPARR